MNTKTTLTVVSASALAAGMAQGAVNQSPLLNLQQVSNGGNAARQGVDMTGDGLSDVAFGYEKSTTTPYVDARSSISVDLSQSGIVNIFGRANTGLPVTPGNTMIDAGYAAQYPSLSGQRAYFYNNDADDTKVGDWPNDAITEGYVGIQLTLPGGTSYGWLHIIDNPLAANPTLTLVDWAYETSPGVGIMTPAIVPEPSALALAGLGLATLLVSRKRS